MIPLSIRLSNFMSYGEEGAELDFSGLHTVCLSGDNGDGKTALLDAMTWALWGKARGASQDEIVRLGATEARVEFKFHYEDQVYRVIRSRSKKGRGKTSLEFQVQNGDGEFRPLTEGAVGKTEQKIADTIRMDYETFINSAFLVQGRADEFTQKYPGQRKEILAEILRLSVYDELTVRARDRRKECALRTENLEAEIAEIDRELQFKGDYKREAESLHESIAAIESRIKDKEQELTRKRTDLALLESKQEQIKEAKSRIAGIENDIKQTRSRIDTLERRIAKSAKMLERENEVEEKLKRLAEARAEESKFTDRLTRQLALTKEKNRLEQFIRDKEREVKAELQRLTNRKMELEKTLKDAKEINEQISDLKAALTKAQEAENEKNEIQQKGKNNKARINAFKDRKEQILKEIAKVEAKAAQLQVEDAKCPLCDQDLTPEHRKKVLTRYNDETQRHRTAFAEAESNIKRLEQENAELRPRFFELEKLSKKAPDLQRQLGMMQQKEKDIGDAKGELPNVAKMIEELQAVLNDQSYAKEESKELEDLNARIAENGYREDVHRKLKEEIARLQGVESQKAEIDRARSIIETDREQVAELKNALDQQTRMIAEEREASAALEKEIAGMDEMANSVSKLEGELKSYTAGHVEMRQKLGKVNAQLEHCERREREKARKLSERAQAAKDAAIYGELEVAFSKNGIQAIIIENALSEIEDEANRLLGLLTDNTMHVTIETQKESKTAGVIETLDIKLSDEIGTRKYELYSGGEKFRADFAIRIALSKLLARRAGARLECLIVDEGFGTQDTSGKERLTEAINAISKDFQMIVVITHIEELKDAFPARIEVDKVPGRGSTLTLI